MILVFASQPFLLTVGSKFDMLSKVGRPSQRVQSQIQKTMSENYVTSDGYRPLILPESGELLQVGRQYALTPLARLILVEEYGLRGVPTMVTCIRKKAPPTRVITTTINLETNKAVQTEEEFPGQEACFSAYVGGGKHLKFEINLAKLDSLAPFYDKSHKLPAFEQDWLNTRSLPPTHAKFRGCSLRWWNKGAITPKIPGSPRVNGTCGPREKKVIDLSILD